MNELKEKAHKIMQELNDAYSKKDLELVKEIFKNLQNGITFKVVSDVVENKELLRDKVIEFRKMIDKILNDIEDIKSDNMFDIISNHNDWEIYFEEMKKHLQEECEILQKRKD